MGKSALAIHLAHELAGQFPDGVLYVNLRGAEDQRCSPLEVLVQFLHALGVASEQIPSDLHTAVAWYRSVLAARRMLVVLDRAAVACYEQSLAICRELEDRHGESITLESLGSLHRERRRDQQAIACFERALAICHNVGDRYHEARVLRELGLTVAAASGADAAHPHWKAALDILESLGAPEAADLRWLLNDHPMA